MEHLIARTSSTKIYFAMNFLTHVVFLYTVYMFLYAVCIYIKLCILYIYNIYFIYIYILYIHITKTITISGVDGFDAMDE